MYWDFHSGVGAGKLPGPDHYSKLTESELKQIAKAIKSASANGGREGSAVKRAVFIILAVLAAVILGVMALIYIPSPKFEPVAYEPIAPDYWPTEGFLTSTPEEQGIDSARLLEMLDFYEEQHAEDSTNSIDSISIVRNGYLVADIYFNPLFPKDTSHIIHSCTKSIMSALIGIAIEQGYIDGVDVPVIDFFTDKEIEITDERMAEVTLKDLLTMQTGIRSQDSYLYGWRGLFETMATDDWVAHILSRPMDVEPGTRFDYSNLSSFLLSAIIHETTGMDTLSYARKNLFDPLGIRDVYWETSPQGIGIGFARMWLKPHDMAKFGMLYLQQGRWDNQQIVPAAWVEESITPHAYPKNYVDVLDENGEKDYEASQRNWVSAKFLRPFSDGYGYQWWLDKSGTYTALGTSGQYIMVAPEENLVVVVTNASSGMGTFFPRKLLDQYILPAIESNGAIAPNVAAQSELAAVSGPPELDLVPQAVPELPAITQEISGETYSLETNRWNYDNFQFVFDPALDYAEFSYTAKVHDAASFHIGLDGVYRYSETAIGTHAAVGTWTAPDTFEISYQHIGYSAPAQFILTFDQDKIDVTEVGLTGTDTYSGKMQ
ncbi:MAG: serine hydrolase domain-containing protein [Anaerolineae bacterium]